MRFWASWIQPTEDVWTLIVNKDWNTFHTSYRARSDFGRVPMQKEALPANVEQLAFTIEPNNTDCLDNLLATYIITKDYDKAFEVAGRYEKISKTPPAKLMELLHSASGK